MKWLLWIVIALVALIAMAWIIGALLPREHSATCVARFKATPRALYDSIVDVAGARSWRKELTKVELLPSRDGKAAWIEESSWGKVNYVREVDEPATRIVVSPGGRADRISTVRHVRPPERHASPDFACFCEATTAHPDGDGASPNAACCTACCWGIYRPSSLALASPTRAAACRVLSSASSIAICNAAFWPSASRACTAQAAAVTTWWPSRARVAACARRAEAGACPMTPRISSTKSYPMSLCASGCSPSRFAFATCWPTTQNSSAR